MPEKIHMYKGLPYRLSHFAFASSQPFDGNFEKKTIYIMSVCSVVLLKTCKKALLPKHDLVIF